MPNAPASPKSVDAGLRGVRQDSAHVVVVVVSVQEEGYDQDSLGLI